MSFYDVLEVDKRASEAELKKAYRSLSLQYHPDRNKDDDAVSRFQKINEAYETLCDSSKRKQYDMQQEMGDGMPPDMNNIFEAFFSQSMGMGMPGMGMHGMGMPGMGMHGIPGMPNIRIFHNGKMHNPKPPPIEKVVSITLEQCYHGDTLILVLEKINQGQIEKEQIQIQIPKGIRDGESVIVPDAGHIGNGVRGDVRLTFSLQPHSVFTRKNNDLQCVKQVTLKDALCGFTMEIPHLNGKMLRLNNQTNIIHPGYVKEVEDYGFVRGLETGKLVIVFEVVFPKVLTEEQIDLIKTIF